MGVLTDPWNLAVILAGAGAYAWARRAKRPDPFPDELWVDDPVRTNEGIFEIGRYLPDQGEPCVWAPWDGGEQHLGIFGTTGSGKTVTARIIAATAKENWDWDVIAIDGAKDGLDFAFMEDAQIGRVIPTDDIAIELTAIADEVDRRGREFHSIRVKRPSRTGGPDVAAIPPNLRFLRPNERRRFGFKPMVVIIDEGAIMLAREKSTPAPPAKKGEQAAPRNPIEIALLRIAAAGRYAGIHLVFIMQRGDAELLKGFIGNLLRARCLVGATDMVAEGMAHSSSTMNLWRELMVADGWEPDGMERALRPPGRAFVSGLSSRAPGLVQLYRFDHDSRFMSWDDHRARGGFEPDDPPASPPPSGPSGPQPPSSGPSSPPLSLVTDDVRASGYAHAARLDGSGAPDSQPPSDPRLRVV